MPTPTHTRTHVHPPTHPLTHTKPQIIDVRHESNAVFAADAHARLTGLGVACVTAGPGVTNTITAVQNAKMAESPVVILGGATSTLLKGVSFPRLPYTAHIRHARTRTLELGHTQDS